MIREVDQEYFDWLTNMIDDDYHSKFRYKNLLWLLYSTRFYSLIKRDENREQDGINLRSIYISKHFPFYPDAIGNESVESFKSRPCSVLEMMVALSDRIESDFMCDPTIGNRTHIWFWKMIENMRLDRMDDSNFNQKYAEIIVSKMINREYKSSGDGGLFKTLNPDIDMREHEIWGQVNVFISEYFY